MYIMGGDLIQYHEDRVKELTRSYQDSSWQQAQFADQLGALARHIRSWFDRDVEKLSGTSGRLETQTIRVKST